MAPTPTILMSSGSKKKEPRYICLSEAKASHSPKICTEVSSPVPHLKFHLTFDRDMKRKHAASNNPCSVACMSLNLIPSTYKTDWLYARMRAFNAKILNICNVVTNVHRPCLITWQTGKKRQHRKCQHHKGHNVVFSTHSHKCDDEEYS